MVGRKKHFLFDMDGTLCESRCHISLSMRDALYELSRKADVVIVSGAKEEQIKLQLGEAYGFVSTLAQSGNHARRKDGVVLWSHELMPSEKDAIYKHVFAVLEQFPVDGQIEGDLIEDRGCQISLSLIGHHAEPQAKAAFDPDRKFRRRILRDMPLGDMPAASRRVQVGIGGSTCLDYTQKGRDKGSNILDLMNKMGWEDEECVFVGDALEEGGNDFSVVGVVDTMPTRGAEQTELFIREILRAL